MKKQKEGKQGRDSGTLRSFAEISGPSKVLSLDHELYQHYLDGSDLSEDQKREFIEALWSIVVTFVDLGFGIEPVQRAIKLSEKELPNTALPFVEAIKEVTLKTDFASTKNQTTQKELVKEGGLNEF